MPAVWLHLTPWKVSVVVAAAAAAALYRVVAELVDGLAGLLAAAMLTTLPLFRYVSTMTLAHTPLVLLGLATVWAYLRWRSARPGRRTAWAACAGALGGWAAVTRPVDAMLFVLPVGAAMAWDCVRRAPRPGTLPVAARTSGPGARFAITLLALLPGAAPFAAVQIIFDYGVTGRPFKTPFSLYNDFDQPQLSFGFRPPADDRPPATTVPEKRRYYETSVMPRVREHRPALLWRTFVGERLPVTLAEALPQPMLAALLPLGLLGAFRGRGWVVAAGLPLFFLLYTPYPIFAAHYPVVVAPAAACAVLLAPGAVAAAWPRARRAVWAGLAVFVAGLPFTPPVDVGPMVGATAFHSPVLRAADERLEALGRKPAVVLFTRDPALTDEQEPVYNLRAAWPDDEDVIRAHDRGPENEKIFRYYARHGPDRAVLPVRRGPPRTPADVPRDGVGAGPRRRALKRGCWKDRVGFNSRHDPPRPCRKRISTGGADPATPVKGLPSQTTPFLLPCATGAAPAGRAGQKYRPARNGHVLPRVATPSSHRPLYTSSGRRVRVIFTSSPWARSTAFTSLYAPGDSSRKASTRRGSYQTPSICRLTSAGRNRSHAFFRDSSLPAPWAPDRSDSATTPAFDVEAERPHRARNHAGRRPPGGHRSLPVDPQELAEVFLPADVVVVAADGHRLRPLDLQPRPKNLGDRVPHGQSVRLREPPGPFLVEDVRHALVGVAVEGAHPGGLGRRPGEVVPLHLLPDGPRAAVDHGPQPVVAVGLELDEVVAAAQRAELEPALPLGERLQRPVRQVARLSAPGERQRAGAVPPPGRDALAEFPQHAAGVAGVAEGVGRGVERHRQHPAPDVSADGGGVEQAARRHRRPDAHVAGEVDVGHHRDVDDVVGPPDPLDRLPRRRLHRPREPLPDRGGRRCFGRVHGSPPSAGRAPAGTAANDRLGARFRLTDRATTARSLADRSFNRANTSNDDPAGVVTSTSSCDAPPIGSTDSTYTSRRTSSAHSPAKASMTARCTCRQSWSVLRSSRGLNGLRAGSPSPRNAC